MTVTFGCSSGLPRWLSGKESACNAGDARSIPGLGRSPGEGNGNPLQYSCLEHSMDRGAWWATVHGVAKSWDDTEQLSMHAYTSRNDNVTSVSGGEGQGPSGESGVRELGQKEEQVWTP